MTAKHAVCLAVFCTVSLETVCRGSDYYVDATRGNDRNTGRGTGAPWKTVAKVNSHTGFRPGDRILFKRGELWREQLIVAASGTADSPILFGSYGAGSRPTLKGSVPVANWARTGRINCWRAYLPTSPSQVFFDGARGIRQAGPANLDRPLEWAWSDSILYAYALGDPDEIYTDAGIEASVAPTSRTEGLVHIKDREYVVVQDLDVTQSYGFGVYIKPLARGITIKGCDVSHSLDGGLVAPAVGAAAASQVTVEDCLIHHNNGGYKEGAPGIATYHEGLTMENVDGFVVRRTRVYDNYMEGVNFKRGARHGVIEYCDLYSNDLINLYLEGATDIVIRYNRIYDCTYNAGIEFGLETSLFDNDTIRIHHNLFWGNSGAISFWGAAVATQTRNISIDNNTFFNNEFSIRWKSSAAGNFGGTNYIRNNLFWPNHAGWSAIRDQTPGRQALAQTFVAHNVFQKIAVTDVTGENVAVVDDVRMVSPASHNFHLRAGSPCIDGGMDVGLTRDYDGQVIPQGAAPDVGADEYVPVASSDAQPLSTDRSNP